MLADITDDSHYFQKAGKAAGPRSPEVSSRQADLVTETEEIAFTAEGRFLEASFYTGGLMKIPKEVKEVGSSQFPPFTSYGRSVERQTE